MKYFFGTRQCWLLYAAVLPANAGTATVVHNGGCQEIILVLISPFVHRVYESRRFFRQEIPCFLLFSVGIFSILADSGLIEQFVLVFAV